VTKLATEAHLNERVEQEVARASRYPQQFSVVLVEPDGDDVEREKLVELARLLRGNCRSIDLVARMSGCRFGLLLPHTGREASILSERICRTVAARLSTPEDQLTVSSGFAVFPTNGRTAADIFAAAHRALLEAKGQGGNRALRAQPVGRAKGQAQPATS
jgi:diguanylate cyclase (GGDEF)-like protein